MKKVFFILFTITIYSTISGQVKNKSSVKSSEINNSADNKQYDDIFEAYDEVKKEKTTSTGMGSLSKQITSTSRYNNTDFGKSKYDKNILWDADIDPNNVQGSINEFRKESFHREWDKTINIGVVLIFIFFIYIIFRFLKESKKVESENESKEYIYNNSISNVSTSDMTTNIEKPFDNNILINKISLILIKDIELVGHSRTSKINSFEKIEIIEKLQQLSDSLKNELIKNKIEYKISNHDIDYIISNAYKSALEKFSEKFFSNEKAR